jgi:stress-induced-phosphoprotein 1
LHGSKLYDEAILAYEEGLKLEDSPATRKGLKEVQDAKGVCPAWISNSISSSLSAHDSAPETNPLGKMFADPNILGKLAANPRTSKYLADTAFVQKIKMMQTNPMLADSALSGDPRMIDVLGVLMGINMQGFSREEGSDELPPGVRKEDVKSPPMPSSSEASSSKSKTTPPPQSSIVEEDTEMEEVDNEEAKTKKDAEDEKKLGTEAYKKREFETAAVHFSKAWELWPKDITFLTNLGGQCSRRMFLRVGIDSFASCLLRTRRL